jgi:hypothetical protein
VKRGVGLLAILLIIMIAGSVLTAGVWGGLPVMHQTADPMGSYFMATPGKAAFFFLVVGFILFNLIGMGATIALAMWFFNREVKVTQQRPNRSDVVATNQADALPEQASA